jgi:hypothetical protein
MESVEGSRRRPPEIPRGSARRWERVVDSNRSRRRHSLAFLLRTSVPLCLGESQEESHEAVQEVVGAKIIAKIGDRLDNRETAWHPRMPETDPSEEMA